MSRPQWREHWRFQLTAATLDRLAVYDLFLPDRVLLLLLYDDGAPHVPAAVRLGALKGPAEIASQPPDCLRRLPAQPNRLVSFFHLADEPADLLGELAILCDGPTRRSFLPRFVGGVLPRQEMQLLRELHHAKVRFDAAAVLTA